MLAGPQRVFEAWELVFLTVRQPAQHRARTPNVTLRAVIYARFSSEKQCDRSIEDQVALCRDGLSVVEVYEDRAISGASTANRLGWQRLMRDARAGRFDVVVAEALDRYLARSRGPGWNS